MAEEPCVTYLNLDSIKNPPMTTIYDSRYLSLDEQYLPKVRETKLDKSSNSLVMRRPRRSRTVFTPEQVAELKYYFMQCNYIRFERAEQIAAKFSLPVGPVRVWFKNQRRKLKIKENENQKHGDRPIEQPQYKPHDIIMTPLTSAPPTPISTPSPSISPIEIKFAYDPIYLDSSAYSVKQEIPYGIKQETAYSAKQKTAYQWLQNLPVITPSQMVYNSASPHHVPQIHSYHDKVINFNRLPYFTLPSPASTTSGDGNHMTVNSDTSDYFSQMSPNSEITEPLTPSSNHGEAESVFNGILDSLKTPETESLIETVFEELTSAPELTIKSEPHNEPLGLENPNCLEYV